MFVSALSQQQNIRGTGEKSAIVRVTYFLLALYIGGFLVAGGPILARLCMEGNHLTLELRAYHLSMERKGLTSHAAHHGERPSTTHGETHEALSFSTLPSATPQIVASPPLAPFSPDSAPYDTVHTSVAISLLAAGWWAASKAVTIPTGLPFSPPEKPPSLSR